MDENVKPKTGLKLKGKRLAYSQDGVSRKNVKHLGLAKNDIPQLSPKQHIERSSPVKKLLSETNKIVKIGMEKDFALHEIDSTLQNSNETIETLRKNMLHLQMEYEKLDQNFQREVSCRTEIVKRMDATKELIESIVQSSNILATSIKQLEDDKLKIAEFYEMIYQNQKEVEMKHATTEKLMKEHDVVIKTKMEEITKFQNQIFAQNSDAVSQLNKKLTYTSDRLKTVTDENEKLNKKFRELQESHNRLDEILKEQERLNSLHRENIVQFKFNLKKIKMQRFKYQKHLKSKKKQLFEMVIKNKNLKKSLEKAKLLHSDCVSIKTALELSNVELTSKFENHLEEDAKVRQNWEAQNQELINKLTEKEVEIEKLQSENKSLNERLFEWATNDGKKRQELEQIQNDLSKMLSENLKLKEDVTKLNRENKDKERVISDLEIKTGAVDADFNSQIEFYKNECGKLQGMVKKLERQLCFAQETLGYEKTQMENVISELNGKLEENSKTLNQKISSLEKLLDIKEENIRKLESEKSQVSLEGQRALNKVDNELQLEILRNKELNKNLNSVKENYEGLNKNLQEAKKQILNYEEKLTELNSLNVTLTQKQNELESNAANYQRIIENEKKSFVALEEKHKKAEKELSKIQKLEEENGALRASTADLKSILEATEARLEGYKMVVKKLENERTEIKSSHAEEVSKLKLELTRMEEAMKKDKAHLATPQKNFQNTPNKKELESSNSKRLEKSVESLSSQKLCAKENEPEVEDIEKWHQATTPPLRSNKKFLSTPRKIFTSTPQASFRNLTPLQKKRDPYEFDSDSSVERFDQEKVLKVFNRQKKESNKKPKTNK